jgi:hypothetical protein
MDLTDAFRQSGLFARLSLLLGFGPLAVGMFYMYRPSERTLTMIRPLSLAAIFGALAGTVSGLVAVLMGVAATLPRPVGWSNVVLGLSEALVPAFVNFCLLAVAWVLVALGMMRRPRLE